jgi:hypothetical protein
MGLNVAQEVAGLQRMTVPDLRRRYAEVFGEETRCRHKEYLWRRIIWRMQALEEGGLSERARRRAEELADDTHLRVRAPRRPAVAASAPQRPAATVADMPKDARLPVPATVLTREYRGKTILVTVLEQGFKYEGVVYRSLSAVAKAVTGSHWNGYGFFGLAGGKDGQQ